MSTILSVPQHSEPAAEPVSDWKQQLSDRLGAYRAKHPDEASPARPTPSVRRESRASKIARSVASRYASAPSYDETLFAAIQASRERENARAAAAAAVARSQREFDLANEREGGASTEWGECGNENGGRVGTTDPDDGDAPLSVSGPADGSVHEMNGNEDRVEGSRHGVPMLPKRFEHREAPPRPELEPEPPFEEFWASALVEPRKSLPSKLIEFPRELISTHHPRLPDPEIGLDFSAPETPRLRIFEAEPSPTPEIDANRQPEPERWVGAASGDRTSTQPDSLPIKFENPELARGRGVYEANLARVTGQRAASLENAVEYSPGFPVGRAFRGLEWASISLDTESSGLPDAAQADSPDRISFLPDAAPIMRRLMAFAVDFVLVTAAFFAILWIFAASAAPIPTGMSAVVAGGAVYLSLWLLYQFLFFSLAGTTAGMLYARISLCTFDDRNPERPALRRRLAAWWLSCLPVGIGFLWCFVDEDNLSWHDRITRTYQRKY